MLILFASVLCLVLLLRARPQRPCKGVTYYPIIGSLPTLLAIAGNFADSLLQMARDNDFRTFELTCPGAHGVYVQQKDDVAMLFGTNWEDFTKNFNENGMRIAFSELLGDGIFAVDGDKWRKQRKAYSMISSRHVIRTMTEDIFKINAQQMLARIPKDGSTFDFQDMVLETTFTSICKIIFGDVKVDHGMMEDFDLLPERCAYRFFVPGFVWRTKRFFGLGNESTTQAAMSRLHRNIDNLIANHNGDGLLGEYMNRPDSGSPRDFVINLLLAGRDTTAAAITAVVQVFLQEKFEPKRFINEDNYAEAVVRETVRLYPPVGVDTRICNKRTLLPSGVIVRPGTNVVVLINAMGRNPFIWTNKPDTFLPERFLTKMPKESDQPVFWSGKRRCIGEQIALASITTTIRILLSNLDLKASWPTNHQFRLKAFPVRQLVNGLPVYCLPVAR